MSGPQESNARGLRPGGDLPGRYALDQVEIVTRGAVAGGAIARLMARNPAIAVAKLGMEVET